jgi:hypothetical protein
MRGRDQVEDLAEDGIGADPLDRHLQRALVVDRAADQRISGPPGERPALPG